MNQIFLPFFIGIHTLVHQNNNVAFKRFDLSLWWTEPSGTLSGTMWFQIVVHCITKCLQAIVHDGCPSLLASKRWGGD